MNNQFDELTKGLAQSVTRRGALKKFGLGVVGMALAALGLANRAYAAKPLYHCQCNNRPNWGCERYPNISECIAYCATRCERGF
jgi:hypothetical protein